MLWAFKPNDPGTVTLGEPFLVGAVRHNNFTISTWNDWVHSTFDIRIGDLEESFPFDQYESTNDTETTAVPRAGGPYRYRIAGSGTYCPPRFALQGAQAWG